MAYKAVGNWVPIYFFTLHSRCQKVFFFSSLIRSILKYYLVRETFSEPLMYHPPQVSVLPSCLGFPSSWHHLIYSHLPTCLYIFLLSPKSISYEGLSSIHCFIPGSSHTEWFRNMCLLNMYGVGRCTGLPGSGERAFTEPMAELTGQYAGCPLAQVWKIRKVGTWLKLKRGGGGQSG